MAAELAKRGVVEQREDAVLSLCAAHGVCRLLAAFVPPLPSGSAAGVLHASVLMSAARAALPLSAELVGARELVPRRLTLSAFDGSRDAAQRVASALASVPHASGAPLHASLALGGHLTLVCEDNECTAVFKALADAGFVPGFRVFIDGMTCGYARARTHARRADCALVCSNCVRHVTEALSALAGVVHVEVQLASNSALVYGAPQMSELVSTVEDAGYDVVTREGDEAELPAVPALAEHAAHAMAVPRLAVGVPAGSAAAAAPSQDTSDAGSGGT